MKRAIWLLVFLGSLSLVPWGAYRLTGGFQMGKLAFDRERREQVALDPDLEAAVHRILGQPFSYLSHGRQAFVFESRDRQWVLKLFRDREKPHPWRQWFEQRIWKKGKKQGQDLKETLAAAQLAYEKGSDLTGLFYVHGKTTGKAMPHVELKSALGKGHLLDLTRYRFALQRRGVSLQEKLLPAFEQAPQTAEVLLRSLLELFCERASRSLRNADRSVLANFGFIGNRAIEWDFGNYREDPSLCEEAERREEIQRFALRLRRFLERKAPQWISFYDRELERVLHHAPS